MAYLIEVDLKKKEKKKKWWKLLKSKNDGVK